jgi:hypothetical protein
MPSSLECISIHAYFNEFKKKYIRARNKTDGVDPREVTQFSQEKQVNPVLVGTLVVACVQLACAFVVRACSARPLRRILGACRSTRVHSAPSERRRRLMKERRCDGGSPIGGCVRVRSVLLRCRVGPRAALVVVKQRRRHVYDSSRRPLG